MSDKDFITTKAYGHVYQFPTGLLVQEQNELNQLAHDLRIEYRRKSKLLEDAFGTSELKRLKQIHRETVRALFEREGKRTAPIWADIENLIDSSGLQLAEHQKEVVRNRLAYKHDMVYLKTGSASQDAKTRLQSELKYDRLIAQMQAARDGKPLLISMRYISNKPALCNLAGIDWYGTAEFDSWNDFKQHIKMLLDQQTKLLPTALAACVEKFSESTFSRLNGQLTNCLMNVGENDYFGKPRSTNERSFFTGHAALEDNETLPDWVRKSITASRSDGEYDDEDGVLFDSGFEMDFVWTASYLGDRSLDS